MPKSSDDRLLVGVDAGTTNTKALVTDLRGRIVASASVATPVAYPRPEWAEYDPETLWQVAAGAIRQAVGEVDEPGRIVGVCFASMGETAVPLDATGQATARAIAWFDKRAQTELAEIEAGVGPDRLFEITGLSPEPIFGLCKLLWFRRHDPHAFGRTVKWLNVADYLAWRLGGAMATDYSLACRTYALDLAALAWSEDVLRCMDVSPSLFAPLARNGQALGTVGHDAAAATGLPAHCGIAAGGHDHIIGAIAADAMRPGVMLSSTGTTEAVLMAASQPTRQPRLGQAGYTQGISFVDQPVWYVLGGLFTAGGAVEWFRQTMAGGADYDTLVAEAEAAPPGCLGAGFLPHLRLGTAPHPERSSRGAFFGLSTDIQRGHLFRAVLEGIAADTRLCYEGMLEITGVPAPNAHRIAGGMTRNSLYMRIKAATAGRPITAVDMPDSVPAGAALLAGIGAGAYANLAEGIDAIRPPETVIQPDPALAALYQRRLNEVYRGAFARLQPLNQATRLTISE